VSFIFPEPQGITPVIIMKLLETERVHHLSGTAEDPHMSVIFPNIFNFVILKFM
jgi:hypothetical protein